MHALSRNRDKKTDEYNKLTEESVSVEQQCSAKLAAVMEDKTQIDKKVNSARATKPENEGLVVIYEANKAVESARAELEQVKEELESRKQAAGSIKESLLRLRKQQQTAKEQACALVYAET